ncbi:hypothetical protein Pelo_11425 [Pelomyxa schiedti]|nr:hypothetical protein Pelo_11425 [Pelomyxa schiedti]
MMRQRRALLDLSKVERAITEISTRTSTQGSAATPKIALHVILASGSFAPPHLMHLEMLKLAKKALEDRHYIVAAAFFSPSSDEYVMAKLGEDDFICLDDRCQMCELISSEFSWLNTLTWGWCSGTEICESLKEILAASFPEYTFEIHEVYGADFALSYRAWERKREMLIVGRPGYTEQLQAELEKRPDSKLILLDELSDISSTAIREALWSRDTTKLSHWMDPKVVEYLLKIKY